MRGRKLFCGRRPRDARAAFAAGMDNTPFGPVPFRGGARGSAQAPRPAQVSRGPKSGPVSTARHTLTTAGGGHRQAPHHQGDGTCTAETRAASGHGHGGQWPAGPRPRGPERRTNDNRPPRAGRAPMEQNERRRRRPGPQRPALSSERLLRRPPHRRILDTRTLSRHFLQMACKNPRAYHSFTDRRERFPAPAASRRSQMVPGSSWPVTRPCSFPETGSRRRRSRGRKVQ